MGLTIASFIVALLAITASGTMAVWRKRRTNEDYLVASRNVRPWLTALSTVATNNSGFMFVGMIGYTYQRGLEAIWLMAGWVVGDALAWAFVHPRLRRESERRGVSSLPGLLGGEKGQRGVVLGAGLVTLVFLGVYAAAQLKAGSTALHGLFGWHPSIGAAIGAVIVVLYSFAGGIRADIWTDAAQSLAMIVSMVMVMAIGWSELGGLGPLMQSLESQDAALVEWMPERAAFGVVPFVLGYAFAGLGTIGQPHLMTRIMSVDSTASIRRASYYYFAWYVPFFVASIGVGLFSRAILPDLPALPIAQSVAEPAELALPLISLRLLPSVWVGLALAGLFSATVSTADSQIIVTSGVLTQDMVPRWRKSYLASKVCTLSVAAFALLIAILAPEGVFTLVLVAWSALAACIAPLLVLRLLGIRVGDWTGVSMMLAAIAAVAVWHVSPWSGDLFKIVPGIAAALAVYGASWLLQRLRARGPTVAG